MSSPSDRELEHVFQRLRDGLVPTRGLDAYAVRIDAVRREIHRLLDAVEDGEGLVKFLRGGYGCGKTFTARLACLDAQARGFATSFVVVSESTLRFHKFEELYHEVVGELSTDRCPRGALGDVLDRWIGRVEERLEAANHDPDAPDFDEKVREELERELQDLTRGAAPADFVRCVQTIFELKQAGEYGDAGLLLSWLGGSGNIAASVKKRAGLKGDIDRAEALNYLRGIVAIVRRAGYAGLVIVVDETETLLRARSDTRHKALDGLRKIVDAAKDFPHLMWVFTGTPEFFDSPRGVRGLPPLHDRIRFIEHGGFASLRQAQLQLRPFDAATLQQVAVRLRDLFARRSPHPERIRARVGDAFIAALVEDVTRGFAGDVGVVPRQFLRELVNRMDLVEEHPDFDPMTAAGFQPADLSPEEQAALRAGDEADGDPLTPADETW